MWISASIEPRRAPEKWRWPSLSGTRTAPGRPCRRPDSQVARMNEKRRWRENAADKKDRRRRTSDVFGAISNMSNWWGYPARRLLKQVKNHVNTVIPIVHFEDFEAEPPASLRDREPPRPTKMGRWRRWSWRRPSSSRKLRNGRHL